MATRTSPDRKSSRKTLFPGEAKAFARSGVDPEEALGYLSDRVNAHQASSTAEDPTSTLEDRQGSAPAGSTPPHGSRARRDLALLRRSLKVTSGEVAVLAGKDPSAVTHWRKGQKKFPEPVVGGRSPLFNFDEVHDWLERHDKLANEPDAAWLWRKSVQALHQATGQEGRSRLRGYVTAMVVVLPDFLDDISGFVELRETAGLTHWFEETGWDLDGDPAKFLDEHLTGVDTDHEARACTARAFRYAIDSGCTQRGLLDDALDALDALSPAQTTTSLRISALITRLAYDLPNPPESVLDLACGEATLLEDLLNPPPNLKPRHSFKLRGIEKDPDTAAIARTRLQLHDPHGEVDWDIRVDDSLAAATPAEAFDVVVVDPPTKKAKEWVNLAKKSLAANRTSRAFVLLPRSALDADGPCASLIRERQLEAVVFLPNRLKKNSRGLALCVITSGSDPCEEILVIDLADLKLKNFNSGTVTPLSDPPRDALPIDQVCDAISHWRNTRTINDELLPGRQRSIEAEAIGKPWEFDTAGEMNLAGGMDLAHRFFTTSVLKGPGTGEPISDSMEEIRLALEHAWAQAIQVGILDPSAEPLTKPVDVPLEELGFNPFQVPPADQLTDLDVLVKSIDKEGLLEPILICESPSGPPRYNILEGHRRYLAVKQLGHETIAAKLLFIGLTDLDSRKPPK